MNKTRPAKQLNHLVFWPPFLLLLLAVVANILVPESFQAVTKLVNDWILTNVGWFFSLVAFSSVLLCVAVCFSKFGQVRIGGSKAEPLMSYWNWFAITICTTIAVGILLWATAEPLTHYWTPPASKNIPASSPESASFAMSTMYLHWTFTPYAIYCAASLMFAFAYYNMKQPFSLGSPLVPLFGERVTTMTGSFIDAICLYSLVAGMAATLGGGILIISGGLNYLIPTIPEKSPLIWALIAGLIIATFIISSATGLLKGIRILSTINTYALIALAIFVFIAGPTIFILGFGLESFGIYLTKFFEMNLFADSMASLDGESKSWSRGWTIFYWAVWMAWTPITACFLGRICYGRTVRQIMMVNFVLPSLFGAAWMAIFSGTALHMEMTELASFGDLVNPPDGSKPKLETVSYAMFEQLPLSVLLVVFYLGSTFVCFVTSADSNTTAMAAISTEGITPESSEGGLAVKIAWGVIMGAVAWVMISFADIEGIKIISILGGFPAAILILLVNISLLRVVLNYKKFNRVD